MVNAEELREMVKQSCHNPSWDWLSDNLVIQARQGKNSFCFSSNLFFDLETEVVVERLSTLGFDVDVEKTPMSDRTLYFIRW